MPALGSKIYCDDNNGSMMFECPGCGSIHALNVTSEGRPRWGFNGDGDKPTFTPSILAKWWKPPADPSGPANEICHSFVTDGRIQFLGDCTHALAGQTVDIPDWDSI